MFNFGKTNKKEKEDYLFTVRTLEDDIKKLSKEKKEKSTSQEIIIQPQKEKQSLPKKEEAASVSKFSFKPQRSSFTTAQKFSPFAKATKPVDVFDETSLKEKKNNFSYAQKNQESFNEKWLEKEFEQENPTPLLEKVLSEKKSAPSQEKASYSQTKEKTFQEEKATFSPYFTKKTPLASKSSSKVSFNKKILNGPFFEKDSSLESLSTTRKKENISSQKITKDKKEKKDWLNKFKKSQEKFPFEKLDSSKSFSKKVLINASQKETPSSQTISLEQETTNKNPYQFLEDKIKKAQFQNSVSQIKPQPQVNKFLLSFAIFIFTLSATFGFSYYFKVIENKPIPLLEPILGKLFETEILPSIKNKPSSHNQEEILPEKLLNSQNLSLQNGNFKKELFTYLENQTIKPNSGILILPEDKNGQKFSLAEIVQSFELDFSDLGDIENKEGWIFAQKDPQKSVWLLGLVIKMNPEEKNEFEANFRKMEKYLPQKMKGLYLEPLPSIDQEVIFRKSSFDTRNRYFNFKNDSLKRSLDYAFINRGNSFFLCIATSQDSIKNLIEIIENTNR